jgi:nucleoid DNA-binding protein
MGLKYRKVKEVNPLDPEGEKIERYEVIDQGVVGTDEIVKEMEERFGIPVKKSKNVVKLLVKYIKVRLSLGLPAPIPTFGTFVPVTKKVKVPGRKGKKDKIVEVREIEFIPSPELEERLQNIELEEVKDETDPTENTDSTQDQSQTK